MEEDDVDEVSLTLEHGMAFDVFDTPPIPKAEQWYQADQEAPTPTDDDHYYLLPGTPPSSKSIDSSIKVRREWQGAAPEWRWQLTLSGQKKGKDKDIGKGIGKDIGKVGVKDRC